MIRTVGVSRDNQDVQAIDIWQDGISATILTWGAAVQDLRLAGHPHPLVLGFRKFKHYPRYSPHFGAIAGRVANRISNGQAHIGRTMHQLDTNFLGKHTLHGGKTGYGVRDWRLGAHQHDYVDLHLDDPDGMMGFPGAVQVTCRYQIKPGNIMAITITATSDAPTCFNPAHHSYFCLDDDNDIRGHEIMIAADHYLRVDEEAIPTGEVVAVAGTLFDLRSMRTIGNQSFDHNFCIGTKRGKLRKVARVRSPKSGVQMDVATTEPGLQFYTGHKLGPPVPGHIRSLYGPYAGLCLEPQCWPDAPTHNHFPSIILHPGDTFIQHNEFAFSRS